VLAGRLNASRVKSGVALRFFQFFQAKKEKRSWTPSPRRWHSSESDRDSLGCGSILSTTTISAGKCYDAMAGDASGAAPSPILKFTTENFVAILVTIQSRT
jgi:hypothetical protein